MQYRRVYINTYTAILVHGLLALAQFICQYIAWYLMQHSNPVTFLTLMVLSNEWTEKMFILKLQ